MQTISNHISHLFLPLFPQEHHLCFFLLSWTTLLLLLLCPFLAHRGLNISSFGDASLAFFILYIFFFSEERLQIYELLKRRRLCLTHRIALVT